MSKNEIIKVPTPLEKMIGCLLGVAIGDALGMPWETMSQREIMLATRQTGVAGFSSPRQMVITDTMYFEAGQFTDDFQLTRAVAKSLIRCHGFDLIDCLKEHLAELEISDCGFGQSTRENLLVLKELLAGAGKTGRVPLLPQGAELRGQGAGNGVAMKIAPLALFFHQSPEELFEAIRKLGSVTHKDPQAYLSAYLVAKVIGSVFAQSIGFCSKAELKNQIAGLASNLIAEIVVRENAVFGGRRSQLQFNMIELGRLINSGQIADPKTVAETLGTDCHCAQSVPFAIAMFLRHPTNFQAAVIETINQGGDTDTNASLVGAMVGANLGALAIPGDWRAFRPEYAEAGLLAKGLYQVMGIE